MRTSNKLILFSATLFTFAAFLAGCGGSTSGPDAGGNDPNETAATVNGKPIKMEEVDRAIKQQAQGQENRLSALELAAGRLQVLQSLIEQEVMYQKAEKEGVLPSDEEVNGEFNKRKTASGLSQEQFDAKMKEIGENEASARLAIKKGLAIQKLNDKITGKIEPPKDNEIAQFYNNNPEAFKNKRGAQLGAIVIDPRDTGQGDTTRNELEAQTKAKEIGSRVMQGADFATVAREASEDADSRLKGGDWRYFTEEEMKQAFPQGFAEYVMTKMQNGQIFQQLIPFEGRYLIIKLQRKQETDEDRTLETPGVRQEITDFLINSRKQLLAASYQAISMNEAKIENFLAKKVVTNPNELSGARPAVSPTTANTNSSVPSNTPATSANVSTPQANSTVSNSTTNAAKPIVNANRPAANTPKPAAAPNTSGNSNK
ncbi:MAG: SurA N-terminal domain-containing protein [Pyrinomonadaceae bacterium]